MRRADYAVAWCLSVCPSVTCRYSVEMAKRSSNFFHHRVATPFYYSFSVPNSMAIFRRGPPHGVSNARGMRKIVISTNVSLYLGNYTRQSYTDNVRPIESCIWSVERRHFQWPWTTLNPDFKVVALLDAECLRNGTRYIVTLK